MNNEEAIELSHYPGGRPHGQVIIIQMLVIDDDVSTIIMIIDIYTMLKTHTSLSLSTFHKDINHINLKSFLMTTMIA